MVREVSNLAPFDHKLITQEPEGFSTSGLKIQLGTGWYGYEGQWRWMKPISNFWVYSEDDSPVLLRLLPEIIVMEGPAFGNRGKMTISQDNKPIANLEIKTGTYAYTDLNLRPGYNLITLELAAEPFVGKRMVPGSEDERELGMLVKIVELRILDSIPK
jgi:hypothetical protein